MSNTTKKEEEKRVECHHCGAETPKNGVCVIEDNFSVYELTCAPCYKDWFLDRMVANI